MPLTNREIWDHAVPLEESWLKFIDELWPEPPRSQIYHTLLEPALPGEYTGQPGKIWEHYNPKDFAARIRQREAIPFSYGLEILAALEHENLTAYGKPWLPELRDEIVRIPAEMFRWDAEVRTNVSWASGQVTHLGRSYTQVRVISPARLGQLQVMTTAKQGRPSYKPEIQKAVRHFAGRDSNWFKKPRRERREDIIRYCQNEFSYAPKGRDPDGFSLTICDEVIAEVRRDFREQASRKLPD